MYRMKCNPVWHLSVERPAILILIGETHVLDEHHLTLLDSVKRESRVQVVTKLNLVGNSKEFISFDFRTVQILPEETSARNACHPSTTQTVTSFHHLLPLRVCDAAFYLHSLMILLISRKHTSCLCSQFVFLTSVKSQN